MFDYFLLFTIYTESFCDFDQAESVVTCTLPCFNGIQKQNNTKKKISGQNNAFK